MWWLLIGALVVIVGLVVVLQRRGETGIPGYQPKETHDPGFAGGHVPPGTDGGGGG